MDRELVGEVFQRAGMGPWFRRFPGSADRARGPAVEQKKPTWYTGDLWQLKPPPGIITTIMGRSVCGGSWHKLNS
jgi:hypothetical protein